MGLQATTLWKETAYHIPIIIGDCIDNPSSLNNILAVLLTGVNFDYIVNAIGVIEINLSYVDIIIYSMIGGIIILLLLASVSYQTKRTGSSISKKYDCIMILWKQSLELDSYR